MLKPLTNFKSGAKIHLNPVTKSGDLVGVAKMAIVNSSVNENQGGIYPIRVEPRYVKYRPLAVFIAKGFLFVYKKTAKKINHKNIKGEKYGKEKCNNG